MSLAHKTDSARTNLSAGNFSAHSEYVKEARSSFSGVLSCSLSNLDHCPETERPWKVLKGQYVLIRGHVSCWSVPALDETVS